MIVYNANFGTASAIVSGLYTSIAYGGFKLQKAGIKRPSPVQSDLSSISASAGIVSAVSTEVSVVATLFGMTCNLTRGGLLSYGLKNSSVMGVLDSGVRVATVANYVTVAVSSYFSAASLLVGAGALALNCVVKKRD